MFVERIRRDESIIEAAPDTLLHPGDVVAIAAQALAYVPKQDIKVERDGLTKFKFSGKNTRVGLSLALVPASILMAIFVMAEALRIGGAG